MDGFNARWWKGKRIYWEKYKSVATGWMEVWCGVEGWKKRELYKTSQFESSNKQTEMKNWMDEKSESVVCVCPCPIFILDDSLPNYRQWWTEISSVFLSLLFCVILRERGMWKRWIVGMAECGAFRPKKMIFSRRESRTKETIPTNWLQLFFL